MASNPRSSATRSHNGGKPLVSQPSTDHTLDFFALLITAGPWRLSSRARSAFAERETPSGHAAYCQFSREHLLDFREGDGLTVPRLHARCGCARRARVFRGTKKS